MFLLLLIVYLSIFNIPAKSSVLVCAVADNLMLLLVFRLSTRKSHTFTFLSLESTFH